MNIQISKLNKPIPFCVGRSHWTNITIGEDFTITRNNMTDDEALKILSEQEAMSDFYVFFYKMALEIERLRNE